MGNRAYKLASSSSHPANADQGAGRDAKNHQIIHGAPPFGGARSGSTGQGHPESVGVGVTPQAMPLTHPT